MQNDAFSILLVDDEVELLRPLKNMLELKDYSVVTATGGVRAWEIYKEQSFDLVLTDVNMADGDGIDLIKNIKKHNLTFPVVCFATDTSIMSFEQIYQLGVEIILSKPFEFQFLCENISRILKFSSDQKVVKLPFPKGLIFIKGSGDVEHGRGGLSFSYDQQTLPEIGSLCRFGVQQDQWTVCEGIGWLRWVNKCHSRLGIELVKLQKGGEARKDYLKGKEPLVYIP